MDQERPIRIKLTGKKGTNNFIKSPSWEDKLLTIKYSDAISDAFPLHRRLEGCMN